MVNRTGRRKKVLRVLGAVCFAYGFLNLLSWNEIVFRYGDHGNIEKKSNPSELLDETVDVCEQTITCLEGKEDGNIFLEDKVEATVKLARYGSSGIETISESMVVRGSLYSLSCFSERTNQVLGCDIYKSYDGEKPEMIFIQARKGKFRSPPSERDCGFDTAFFRAKASKYKHKAEVSLASWSTEGYLTYSGRLDDVPAWQNLSTKASNLIDTIPLDQIIRRDVESMSPILYDEVGVIGKDSLDCKLTKLSFPL
jgi:hypothetical protein